MKQSWQAWCDGLIAMRAEAVKFLQPEYVPASFYGILRRWF